MSNYLNIYDNYSIHCISDVASLLTNVCLYNFFQLGLAVAGWSSIGVHGMDEFASLHQKIPLFWDLRSNVYRHLRYIFEILHSIFTLHCCFCTELLYCK